MGKILEDIGNDVKNRIGGFAPVGSYFFSSVYKEPSTTFPNICISKRFNGDGKRIIVNNSNYPLLVPILRNQKADFLGVTSFNTDLLSWSGGSLIIPLSGSNTTILNDKILDYIVEYVYYHNDLDRASLLNHAEFDNLNLVIRINGIDLKLQWINLITRTLYAADPLQLVPTGIFTSFEFYPYRIPASEANFLTLAQIRKLSPETTLATGYTPNQLLENRFQYFSVELETRNQTGTPNPDGTAIQYYDANSGLWNTTAFKLGGQSSIVKSTYLDTPRQGRTNRGNILSTEIYMYGGKYNA